MKMRNGVRVWTNKSAVAAAVATVGLAAVVPASAPVRAATPGGYASPDNMTLTGHVTDVVPRKLSNDAQGQEFTMRAQNGFTYRVHALFDTPATLSSGDVVRAYGDWRDGELQARNVRVLREGDPTNLSFAYHRNRLLTGYVTSRHNGMEFVVRTRDGFSYLVHYLWNTPQDLNVGDRVRVFGDWQDGELYASGLRILRQGYASDVHLYAPASRQIRGVVVSHATPTQLTVRASNGFVYRVQTTTPVRASLNVGDRVRCYGQWEGATLHASSVRILRQGI